MTTEDAPSRPVLPPGTILQFLYLKERLAGLERGRFVEVGCGRGELSALLVAAGWRGVGYESGPAATHARRRNGAAINDGRFELRPMDWFTADDDDAAELVISSMVIEHLPPEHEAAYFERARRLLRPGGRAIVLAPASMAHWGVEDEIAGHQRRYSRAGIESRLAELGWTVDHVAGLTFPVSNLLLPVSNWLVARAETDRLGMSCAERTRLSGDRSVGWKTEFPEVARLVLNERVLYPLHVLQKAFTGTDRALVLYVEATPAASVGPPG